MSIANVLCGTARSAQLVQANAQTGFAEADDCNGMFILINHDATPQLLRFGKLQAFLEPFARYLCKVGGSWKAVDYNAYFNIEGTLPKGNLGVVEVMGTLVEISWDSGSKVRDCITAPVIVERANASNFYGALNSVLGPVSEEGIISICDKQKCIIVLEVPDAAKYVRKLKKFRANRSPKNCFLPDLTCLVHRLH